MSNDREKNLWAEIERRDVLLAIFVLILILVTYLIVGSLMKPGEGFLGLVRELILDVLGNIIPVFLAFLVVFYLFRKSQALKAEKESEELVSKFAVELEQAVGSQTAIFSSKLSTTKDTMEVQLGALKAEILAQRQFLENVQQGSNDLDMVVENFDDTGLRNWIVTGKWRIEQDENNHFLTVTDSEVGGILKPCLLWTDYVFQFETKIVHSNSSWIIRANSLHNYVMLQCGIKELNPHFRIDGGWLRSDSVAFSFELPTNAWFNVKVTVDGSRVAVVIKHEDKEAEVFDRYLLEPPLKFVPLEPGGPSRLLRSYPIGSVGFRAYDTETAYFRNVKVRRI